MKPMEQTTYVYITLCSDGSFYTGVAKDIEKRLAQHNSGRGAKYTSSRRPVKLRFLETCPSLSVALKRERQIKRMRRVQKEALVLGGKRLPKKFRSL